MTNDNELQLNLYPPQGKILQKYIDFRDNWDFPEMAYLGIVGTAKTTSLVDSLVLSAIDYPGAEIFLARDTLVNLKRSTIGKLRRRVNLVLDSMNEKEAIYRLPPQPDPVTGAPATSLIRCLGLDVTDIEQTLSSTEPFRFGIEEGGDVPSDAHDVALMRSRQIVYHRSWKIKHLVIKLSRQWTEFYAQPVTPQMVMDAYGWAASDLDHPMPGNNGVKTISNPSNDHLWMRYVSEPYPDEGIYEDFVKRFFGVKEVFRTFEEMVTISATFAVGDMAIDPGGNRQIVAKVVARPGEFVNFGKFATPEGSSLSAAELNDPARQLYTLHFVDGTTAPNEKCRIVMRRNAIFAFNWENESVNQTNIKNALLIVNEAIREEAYAGKQAARKGRVFNRFINSPADQGGHILPSPGRKRLNNDYTVLVGLDQGGAHATAAAFALLTKKNKHFHQPTRIFWEEYLSTGETAKESAYHIMELMLPRMRGIWGGDPAMFARNFGLDRNDDGGVQSTADRYIEAGIDLMPGVRGKVPFEDVNDLFAFRDGFLGEPRTAGLYVFEHCEFIIETLEKLTWHMVDRERSNPLVDMGDAIKIAVAMESYASAMSADGETGLIQPPSHAKMPHERKLLIEDASQPRHRL